MHQNWHFGLLIMLLCALKTSINAPPVILNSWPFYYKCLPIMYLQYVSSMS